MLEEVQQSAIDAAREQIRNARHVVVKIGSNVLVGDGPSAVDRRIFCSLVEEIAALDRHPDRRIFLVTSGAIAVARRKLGITKAPGETMSRKQALAALGQPALMHLYASEFALYGKQTAQVLISPENLQERERFINARNTLRELALVEGCVTIINENDTTSTEEIRFGDNDHLSALVCPLVDADVLVILSDVDSLYTADPRTHADAERIAIAWSDDRELQHLAKPPDPHGPGSGGMATKLKAARVAGSNGIPTIIAPGRRAGVLSEALRGEGPGTLFVPRSRRGARKTWLAFATRPSGELRVDDGARRALVDGGRSLLSIGIREVQGTFGAGAAVDIATLDGDVFARGLANYSSVELQRIAAQSSDRIIEELGYSNGDAVVHRDDLVLLRDL